MLSFRGKELPDGCEGFLAAIHLEPAEHLHYHALADWLQERDEHLLAEHVLQQMYCLRLNIGGSYVGRCITIEIKSAPAPMPRVKKLSILSGWLHVHQSRATRRMSKHV